MSAMVTGSSSHVYYSVPSSHSVLTTVAALPSVDEVVKADAFPTAIWQLDPHQEGMLPVAVGRGGPFSIHWEVHGNGPVKLVVRFHVPSSFIGFVWSYRVVYRKKIGECADKGAKRQLLSGMGVLKTSWQRQTMHFGHLNSDRYSVLILDNRGIGRSDKPLMRYSTSAMAADVLEVLDHLSWTGERQLHICGISMGGMIAQEIAYAAPGRIASLSLVCTAAAIENTTSFSENMLNRITMLLPKSSLDRTVAYSASNIFPADWLAQPDDAALPDETVPRCRMPQGGWPYRRFKNNYARFAAQEITKQRDREGFSKPNFLLQVVAAGWHHKSAAQLREIGDKVGRDRILVLHGTEDRIISVPHGRKLIEYLQPGKSLVVDGMGHAPIVERTMFFNGLLAETCALGEQLSGR
ncbi:alpha/beta-hydrolase [Xylariaceae sp. AK1471]|nr:alpha/beta-hydrolase [Xylariaceae sp. AK1471]